MRTTLKALLAAATLAAFTTVAAAKCPLGTSYQCSQGFGGKVICGCR